MRRVRSQSRQQARRADKGFTLIEVLVALAVFSIAVIAHLHLQSENTRTLAMLEERAYAQIVAENRLAELLAQTIPLPVGSQTGQSPMGARDWAWSQRIMPTDEESMLRVEVSVSDDATGQVIASVSGFQEAR